MASALRAGIARWLPEPPAGSLPLALPSRRIYIVPSRFGVVYGAALFLLLLGSLNYNNNAAILLALLLGMVAMASAVTAVRFLAGLQLVDFSADEVFAGDTQPCRLIVRGHRGSMAGELLLRHGDTRVDAHTSPQGDALFVWHWASERRGRRALNRIRLSTTYPLGLFYAWCTLEPHVDAVVYPVPETPPPPLPPSRGELGEHDRSRHGDDDWHALREFQRGDSLRDIAWKVSARHDRWLVADTRRNTHSPVLRLSLDQVATLPRERGISRLTRWILMAEAERRPYQLTLPGRTLGPDVGPEHRRLTLTALAELP